MHLTRKTFSVGIPLSYRSLGKYTGGRGSFPLEGKLDSVKILLANVMQDDETVKVPDVYFFFYLCLCIY